MGDLIRRQAAIDEIEKYFGDLAIQGRFDILSIIKNLPSAQAKLDENDMPEQQESDKLGVKTGETCTDCISRQAAIDEIARWIGYIDEDMILRIQTGLKKVSSAQPERKRGKWIKNDNGTYSCDQCHSWIPNEQHYYARYCIFCGAPMEAEE